MENSLFNIEEDPKPQKLTTRYPTFKQNLWEYFSEYSNKTSIHGVRYLGEKKRSFMERLVWLIVLVVSLYVCISFIAQAYQKWQKSSIILHFAKSPTPIWQVPFPAITICSETKARQSIYNFTNAYHINQDGDMNQKELGEQEKVSLVCDSHLHPVGSETTDYSTIDFLAKIAPTLDEVFYSCKWMDQTTKCSDLFIPMISEEGICFTFNMLDRKDLYRNTMYHYRDYLSYGKKTDWNLEKGYYKNSLEVYPKRAVSAGQGAGLQILLRAYDKDLDYICRGPVQGFKLLLHNPGTVPRVSQSYLRAPLNQEIVAAVKPHMITTSRKLESYDRHKRQCYFSNEKHLKFYNIYTQENCEVECLANYTLKRCGCVSFHMPHDEKTTLCGSGKTICVHEAHIELFRNEINKNLAVNENKDSPSRDENRECDCLPACTSLTYDTEYSQADFNWPMYMQASKMNSLDLKGTKMTGIKIFFKEMHFITSERTELYGLIDFLANCGGILLLFMGFSFLSIVEVLYFLSLRLVCNVRNYGLQLWSGSAELLKPYLQTTEGNMSGK